MSAISLTYSPRLIFLLAVATPTGGSHRAQWVNKNRRDTLHLLMTDKRRTPSNYLLVC